MKLIEINRIAKGYFIILSFKYLNKISEITLAWPVAMRVTCVLKPFSFKNFIKYVWVNLW